MRQQNLLARLANNMVGVNASNTSIIDRMRKAADGKSEGEPWCVCFVQWAVRETDALVDEILLTSETRRQRLPTTESTQLLWTLSPQEMHTQGAIAGSVVVWQLAKDKTKGHCGIVTEVVPGGIVTVEGNTGPAAGAAESERNGNGIWQKRRAHGEIPGLVLLGYLLPWG